MIPLICHAYKLLFKFNTDNYSENYVQQDTKQDKDPYIPIFFFMRHYNMYILETLLFLILAFILSDSPITENVLLCPRQLKDRFIS